MDEICVRVRVLKNQNKLLPEIRQKFAMFTLYLCNNSDRTFFFFFFFFFVLFFVVIVVVVFLFVFFLFVFLFFCCCCFFVVVVVLFFSCINIRWVLREVLKTLTNVNARKKNMFDPYPYQSFLS